MNAMRTSNLPRYSFILALAIAASGIPPSSPAQNADLPVVSIRGGGFTPEYCPPNADCVGLGFMLTRTGPGLGNPLTVRISFGGTAT